MAGSGRLRPLVDSPITPTLALMPPRSGPLSHPAAPSSSAAGLNRLPGWVDQLNGALALAVVFLTCLIPIPVSDFWWQAKAGELILHTGRVPTRDPFSWTALGQPWQAHEWLTELLFYLLLTRLPTAALLLYKCGLAALTAGLVLARARLRSGSPFWAVAAAVAVGFVLRNSADLRPQMLSFVALAGMLLLLDRYRLGELPRLPWILPPLFALWANLHGGVVVGIAVLVVWVTGEVVGQEWYGEPGKGVRPLVWSALLSALAITLNPYGIGVYTYPFHVLDHPRVQDYISEWYSPNFHLPVMRGLLTLVVVTAGVLPLARGREGGARWADMAVIAAALLAALTSQRNGVLFALAAAPVTAAALASLWRDAGATAALRRDAGQPLVRALAGLGVTVLLGFLLYRLRPPVPPDRWYDYGIDRVSFPEQSVRLMQDGMWPGRMYNDYVWGGYLIWNLYPQRRVFVDGRAEVYYPSGAFEEEMTLHTAGDGWDRILDRRRVEVVLTARGGSLAHALEQRPGWKLAFTGPVEVVYTRASGTAP